jgi:bidirectional [NiFe] hydrogenase diaphorase subunit
VQESAQIKPGETTPDNAVSLLTARCIGSCGLAPAVVFDGEIAGRVQPEEMAKRMWRWLHHDA